MPSDEPGARIEHDAVGEVLLGAEGEEREAEAERDERPDGRVLHCLSPSEPLRAAVRPACPRPWSQTFSTSGLPRMPEGMKISVMARIEKAATSL